MSRATTLACAKRLHEAACVLRDAVASGDAERTERAMQDRTTTFDALTSAAGGAALDPDAAAVVRDVLEIDREVESALRSLLDELRGEIDQIGNARRVARRQHTQDAEPRYVSRRA